MSILEAGDIVFARHAASKDNERKISLLDAGDPPLSLRGIDQARQLGAFLVDAGIDCIVSSTARRAAHTSEIVAGYLDVPVYYEADLRELDWGPCAGMPKIEVFTQEEDDRAMEEGLDYRVADGAETMAEVHDRVASVVSRYRGYGTVLFETHGQTMRSYVAGVMEWNRQQALQFKPGNAHVYEFEPLDYQKPRRIYPEAA